MAVKLAELINRHDQQFLYSGKLDDDQFRTFSALRHCRQSSAKKGVLYSCDDCGKIKFIYNSCGNRFCPNCQNHRTTEWLNRQKQKLLPCMYYMITFTLPAEFRKVPRSQLAKFYKAFFDCSSAAIKELAADRLKGECGMLGVLHTNSRTLEFHPHIHYVIPGVILNKTEGTVKQIRTKRILGFTPLMLLFRGKFLDRLKELGIAFPSYLYGRKWNVNVAQKGDGQSVLEYLSRYLVKGVVSQKALQQKDGKVELNYLESSSKTMRKINFDELEFLERLARHVLPKGFRSIREYGFLAPAGKKMLRRIQLLLRANIPEEDVLEKPPVTCSCCQGKMSPFILNMSTQWYKQKIEPNLPARSPPKTSVEA